MQDLVTDQCFHVCHSLETSTVESCPYDLFSISSRISGENNKRDEYGSRGNSSNVLIDCVDRRTTCGNLRSIRIKVRVFTRETQAALFLFTCIVSELEASPVCK